MIKIMIAMMLMMLSQNYMLTIIQIILFKDTVLIDNDNDIDDSIHNHGSIKITCNRYHHDQNINGNDNGNVVGTSDNVNVIDNDNDITNIDLIKNSAKMAIDTTLTIVTATIILRIIIIRIIRILK